MIAFLLAIFIAQGPSQVQEVEVPPAPPSLQIVDEEGLNINTLSPENNSAPTFVIRVPVDNNGRYLAPSDARNLVRVLHSALGDDYIRELMLSFGFRRSGDNCCIQVSNRYDLRFNDLYQFIYRIWSLHDESTVLGREIDCLSTGEGSLLPVMVLVAQRELFSRDYVPRHDMPADVHIEAAMAVSDRLLSVCESRITVH